MYIYIALSMYNCIYIYIYDTLLSTQDKEILSILEELENKNDMSNISSQSRLTSHFCSNTVFNLS